MLVHEDLRDLPQQLCDDLEGLPQQLPEIAVDDETDYHDQPRPGGLSHGNAAHHSGSIRDIFRRASMSLRGVVRRRPSVATEAIFEEQPAPSDRRPTTSHLGWNQARHHASVRQSRSFYGLDFTSEPAPMAPRPTHTSYNSRPGLAGEPPIIPRNTGAAAKAAAAMQNEFMARSGLQNRWLHPTASEDNNDDESGVGISVTIPGVKEAQISRVDFVTNLPTELAIHILAYLDAAALAKASLVSQRWKQVINNQHIWRESCLREVTGTYAMSGAVQPNTGLGLPRNIPSSDWRQIYRDKKELDQRWKQGKARPVYLNGHTDSIYCLQFDEYVKHTPPSPMGTSRQDELTALQAQNHYWVSRQNHPRLGHAYARVSAGYRTPRSCPKLGPARRPERRIGTLCVPLRGREIFHVFSHASVV